MKAARLVVGLGNPKLVLQNANALLQRLEHFLVVDEELPGPFQQLFLLRGASQDT